MLDLHANSSGGATTLAAIGTILLGGDGQSVAGQPINPATATLVQCGAMTTIADTIREVRFQSPDQIDGGRYGRFFEFGAASLLGSLVVDENLRYSQGARVVSMRQNTGAANNMAFFLDYYPEGLNHPGSFNPPNTLTYTTTLAAATAITWGANAFAPTTIPNGKYAMLGAYVNALTNHGLLRFGHSSFGKNLPGFPVWDNIATAVANANVAKHEMQLYNGYQFVWYGEQLKRPCCPVFEVSAAQSGLTIQLASITADTALVTLNLMKVGN